MTGRSLCVMQVVSNLEIGGAQEVVRTLAENLEKVGCKSVVCAFKDGPLREGIERLGIPVEILPARKHSVVNLPLFLRDMLRTRRALLGLVKKHGVDVIQTHLLRSLDFLVLSLRLQAPVRVFWTFHNARYELREEHLARQKWLLGPKLWGYQALYRLGARWAGEFVAVSEEVHASILRSMPGLPAERVVTICNSVDVTRYGDRSRRGEVRQSLGLGATDLVAAVVATFKEQKGHHVLLEALPDVVKRFSDLHVLFIGDGALRPALEAQIHSLALNNHVHFLGNRSDVPELLAASDAFLLPSLWEGLPMALVEAMASGLPAIATRVSGTSQVMVQGETGLMVAPGASAELAEAMLKLFSDPAMSARMGSAARQRVEVHFGAQKQAREYLALYSGDLPEAAPTPRGEEVTSPMHGSQ